MKLHWAFPGRVHEVACTMSSSDEQTSSGTSSSGSDSESGSEQSTEIAGRLSDDNSEQPPAKCPKKATTADKTGSIRWTNADNRPCLYGFRGIDGVQVPDLNATSSPVEIFEQFFPPKLTAHIASETNRYATENPKRQTLNPSHMKKWFDTTPDEMSVFLAMTLAMGVMPKRDLKLYWTRDPVLETPFFPNTMPRDRFMDLLAHLHFADNSQADKNDRLYKVRPVVDVLTENFRSVYLPSSHITTEESRWKFKGQLKCQRDKPGMRSRFGIKVYRVCQSTGVGAGYTWNLKIYTKQDKTTVPAGARIVLDLNADLLGNGYTIFLGNSFSSPSLFRELVSHQTNAVGTVKQHRKDMPEDLWNLQLSKGEVAYRSSNTGLLALVWQGKKDTVRMLSTMHMATMANSGKCDREDKPIEKPKCVMEYNEGMKGVDMADQHASYHCSVRKSIKWYRKLFFYLLDVCVVNSHLVHRELGGSDTHLFFRMALVNEISKAHARNLPSYRTRLPSLPDAVRVIGSHYPAEIPSTGRKARSFKRCVHCTKLGLRKETRFLCETCQVALCPAPCFKAFHVK